MKLEMLRVCARAGRSWASRENGPPARSEPSVDPITNTAGTATTAAIVPNTRGSGGCSRRPSPLSERKPSIATPTPAPKLAHIIVTALCG